jgi:hypothetical protein
MQGPSTEKRPGQGKSVVHPMQKCLAEKQTQSYPPILAPLKLRLREAKADVETTSMQ